MKLWPLVRAEQASNHIDCFSFLHIREHRASKNKIINNTQRPCYGPLFLSRAKEKGFTLHLISRCLRTLRARLGWWPRAARAKGSGWSKKRGTITSAQNTGTPLAVVFLPSVYPLYHARPRAAQLWFTSIIVAHDPEFHLDFDFINSI